eukprot:scaffold43036_cov35-Cyclotella_meneghiniana.AAC.1
MQTFSDGGLKGNGVPRVIVYKRDWHQCRQGLAEVLLASVGSIGCGGVALLCCCVAAVMAGDGHFYCLLTRGKRRAISLRLVGAAA